MIEPSPQTDQDGNLWDAIEVEDGTVYRRSTLIDDHWNMLVVFVREAVDAT